MRIARAVIAPDAAAHRVKGRVDRSDSRPSRRMGGLSSWRRAFCRLAFQPRGVCADTGVYAVLGEKRQNRHRLYLERSGSFSGTRFALHALPPAAGVFRPMPSRRPGKCQHAGCAGVSCASESRRSSSMRAPVGKPRSGGSRTRVPSIAVACVSEYSARLFLMYCA